jgi:hypothetical protein
VDYAASYCGLTAPAVCPLPSTWGVPVALHLLPPTVALPVGGVSAPSNQPTPSGGVSTPSNPDALDGGASASATSNGGTSAPGDCGIPNSGVAALSHRSGPALTLNFCNMQSHYLSLKLIILKAFDVFLCAKLSICQYAVWLLSNSERDRCSMKLSLNPKIKTRSQATSSLP